MFPRMECAASLTLMSQIKNSPSLKQTRYTCAILQLLQKPSILLILQDQHSISFWNGFTHWSVPQLSLTVLGPRLDSFLLTHQHVLDGQIVNAAPCVVQSHNHVCIQCTFLWLLQPSCTFALKYMWLRLFAYTFVLVSWKGTSKYQDFLRGYPSSTDANDFIGSQLLFDAHHKCSASEVVLALLENAYLPYVSTVFYEKLCGRVMSWPITSNYAPINEIPQYPLFGVYRRLLGI